MPCLADFSPIPGYNIAMTISDPHSQPAQSSQAVAQSPGSALDQIDFERRFGGIARLYGAAALAFFRRAHICVIGVGGVGSWIVEALARSAIGQLTLIDLDNVAESNINRQIQALSNTLGQAKISALAERIALINPYCQVHQIEDFITPDNVAHMVGGQTRFDYVIDAMDDVKAKAALIAYCRDHQLPLLIIGSAGGQIDPGKIMIRDLAKTEQEPLLAKVRKRLRSQYRFPRGDKVKFGMDAVFSMETLRFPEREDVCQTDQAGQAGQSGQAGITGLNCAGFGSSVVVTASFGMAAAGHVLQKLAQQASLVSDIIPE
jgi:tRNA threonylcarbamoyladenosine dehydratase